MCKITAGRGGMPQEVRQTEQQSVSSDDTPARRHQTRADYADMRENVTQGYVAGVRHLVLRQAASGQWYELDGSSGQREIASPLALMEKRLRLPVTDFSF